MTSTTSTNSAAVPAVLNPEDIFTLQAKITTQQSLIKQMKKDSANASSIAEEVARLTDLRLRLANLEKAAEGASPAFNRKAFDELVLRKMYVVPSFEIHNGPAGLFDVLAALCCHTSILSLSQCA
jgi:glycyl-tRNA synthetase